MQLTPAGAGVIQKVAELAGVGLYVYIVLLKLGIALEDQHLVFGAAGLACGVHRRQALSDGVRAGARWR